jgi:hypothetical protein
MRKEVTFAELERALIKVGFTQSYPASPQKVYQHPSDALVVLPTYHANEPVRPIHMAAVRKTLSEKGLLDPSSFNKFFEGHSSKVSNVNSVKAVPRPTEHRSHRCSYHIIPSGARCWAVKHAGAAQAQSVYVSKTRAIAKARALARAHQCGQVVIHGRNGRIQAKRSYYQTHHRATKD